MAKEVIRRMGPDAAVRAACTDTAGAYTVEAEGSVLETYRAEDNDGDGYISEIEVLRGDFSQVLYDDTHDKVDYVFGDRIAEVTQDADGVHVTFASGDHRRFELVIGADGLHSALRAMVFGPREQFVRHLGLVLAFYTVPNEFGLDRWLIDYQEAGRSAGLRPIRDASQAIAMLSFPAPSPDHRPCRVGRAHNASQPGSVMPPHISRLCLQRTTPAQTAVSRRTSPPNRHPPASRTRPLTSNYDHATTDPNANTSDVRPPPTSPRPDRPNVPARDPSSRDATYTDP